MVSQMLQRYAYVIDPLPVISQLIFYDVLHLYCVFCQQCKGLLFTGIVDVLRGA